MSLCWFRTFDLYTEATISHYPREEKGGKGNHPSSKSEWDTGASDPGPRSIQTGPFASHWTYFGYSRNRKLFVFFALSSFLSFCMAMVMFFTFCPFALNVKSEWIPHSIATLTLTRTFSQLCNIIDVFSAINVHVKTDRAIYALEIPRKYLDRSALYTFFFGPPPPPLIPTPQ